MTTPSRTTTSNPYLAVLWVATALVLLAGLVTRFQATGVESEFDRSPELDPAMLDLAHTLLGIGGMLATGLLVASSVCWQVARR